MTNESGKCHAVGKTIMCCELLARTLEYGNPRNTSKGVFIPERVNITTGKPGTDIAQLHSGEFVGRGIAMNFCPFCGENLVTWEEK